MTAKDFQSKSASAAHDSRRDRTERLVGRTTMQTHKAVKMKSSVPEEPAESTLVLT